eukprot:CAMPEP_0202447896 /NCGR_PEP_ID=MMETSP1360-20130828/6661_1 /ASSEMBLY_ACC=CAM_ASM_000848 /TAXON_ID=515479 /ORGANISM="Licmophora paradoxa, Strain CCMP2313" /LENGTH=267 /DNA_ID=CAMNT_0049065193 /DNA_START=76 /DNA_END=879 /DNA_ORIENTATION=+
MRRFSAIQRKSLTEGTTAGTSVLNNNIAAAAAQKVKIRRSLPTRMSSNSSLLTTATTISSSSGNSTKRVRFGDPPAAAATIGKAVRISDHDRHKIWYTRNDLAFLRIEIKATLKAFKKANNGEAEAPDEEEYCLRGLEDNITGLREKRLRITNYIQGILSEQNRQRTMGVSDPRGLQVLSRACSKQARQDALLVGKNDARDVMMNTEDTRRKRRSKFISMSIKQQQQQQQQRRNQSKLPESFSNSSFGRSLTIISDEERSGSSARSA